MEQDLAKILINLGGELTRYLILWTVIIFIVMAMKEVANDIKAKLSLIMSSDQGTRIDDVIEKDGEPYRITRIGFTRIYFVHLHSGKQRSQRISHYTRYEIIAYTCVEQMRRELDEDNKPGKRRNGEDGRGGHR